MLGGQPGKQQRAKAAGHCAKSKQGPQADNIRQHSCDDRAEHHADAQRHIQQAHHGSHPALFALAGGQGGQGRAGQRAHDSGEGADEQQVPKAGGKEDGHKREGGQIAADDNQQPFAVAVGHAAKRNLNQAVDQHIGRHDDPDTGLAELQEFDGQQRQEGEPQPHLNGRDHAIQGNPAHAGPA